MLLLPFLLPTVSAEIISGLYTFYSLQSDTQVYVWGLDQYGVMGRLTTPPVIVPDPILMPNSLGTTFATSSSFVFCVGNVTGSVRCTGAAESGEFGDGNDSQQIVYGLTQIPGLASGVTNIVGGFSNFCAETAGGFECWGANNLGQLGRGNTDSGAYVEPLIHPDPLSQVALAVECTCVLTTTGFVDCVGDNANGLLGGGQSLSYNTTAFERIPSLASVEYISGNVGTICVLIVGDVWCWGDNLQGTAGTGSMGAPLTVPEQAVTRGFVVDMTAAGYNMCVLYADQTLDCAGNNDQGQLAIPPYDNFTARASLTPFDGGRSDITEFSPSPFSLMVVVDDGRILFAGVNITLTGGLPGTTPYFVADLPISTAPTMSPVDSPTLPTDAPTTRAPTTPTTSAPTASPNMLIPSAAPTIGPCNSTGDRVLTVDNTSFCCEGGYRQQLVFGPTLGCDLAQADVDGAFGTFAGLQGLVAVGVMVAACMGTIGWIAGSGVILLAAVALAFSVVLILMGADNWTAIALFAAWSGLFLELVALMNRDATPAGTKSRGLLLAQTAFHACFVAALFMPVAFYTSEETTTGPVITETTVTVWVWGPVITLVFLFEMWCALVRGTTSYTVECLAAGMILAVASVGIVMAQPAWTVTVYIGALMVLGTAGAAALARVYKKPPTPGSFRDKSETAMRVTTAVRPPSIFPSVKYTGRFGGN